MAQSLNQSKTAPSVDAAPQRTPKPKANDSGRLVVFMHSVAFVLGFTAVFTLLGSAAGLLGANLNQYLPAIQRFGAIMLFVFALSTLGAFRWMVRKIDERTDVDGNPAAAALVSILNFFNALMYTEKRVTDMHNVSRRYGYLSSAFLGVSFSAGWVPCVGPILASILFLANTSTTASQGAILLAIYSLGLGIPFLITGAAFSSATRFLRKLNRHANIVSIVSGVFLLYVAYLLWTDSLNGLTTQFAFLNEWVFQLEEMLALGSGTSGDIISVGVLAAAPIAFTAGIISFISPCVLPLIPAYVGYLGGAAVNTGQAES